MPELPEVEVTKRQLEPLLVGRTIAGLATTGDSYFFLTAPPVLKRRLVGRHTIDLTRHGKYLLADLNDGGRVVFHLGMTGQLFASSSASVRLYSAARRAALNPKEQQAFRADQHTHLTLTFADAGPVIYFRDVRKFGKVEYVASGACCTRLEKLGVDALSSSAADLESRGRRRTIPIKSLLLDQSVVAGVGNIYADEALFLAGIKPTRAANRIASREYVTLHHAMQQVLLRAIEAGGSSIDDFVQPSGDDGGFQHEHAVYGRAGQACRACGAPLRRIVIAQRTSCYCPTCQR